jgi:uncharacterized integral membrane protein (TIGR00697 family)
MNGEKIQNSFKISSKYLLFLSMLYMSIAAASATIAYKFVNFGFFTVSGAAVIFQINFFISNIISDTYGYSVMRQIIWRALICEIIFALLIKVIIGFENLSQFPFQSEYDDVLGQTLKFAISGVLADLVGLFSNIFVFSKLKLYTKGRFFIVRALGSTFVGEFLMLSVFMLFGFNDVSDSEKIKIFLSMYSFHLISDVFLVWPAWLAVTIIKKAENLDVYDKKIDFNPFKITN